MCYYIGSKQMAPAVLDTPRGPDHKEQLMDATSVERSAAPCTPKEEQAWPAWKERVLRGMALWASELGGEIRPLGGGRYAVPSCSGDGHYTVDLAAEEEGCDCPDRLRPCKHLVAGTIYRARCRADMRRARPPRMTPCEGCSVRHPLKALVEVGEDNQDGMHPLGTLLCAPCADRMGVER